MSTKSGNGSFTFGDGTIMPTASVSPANISGFPTQLSQFTNDLGNYGGFLTGANIDTTVRGGYNSSSQNWGLTWSGTQIGITTTNCNCNCNC
jgi:hypothetical protein